MSSFCVTYELYTEASVEAGDAEERGFLVEDVSLREAVDELQDFSWDSCEASSSPYDGNGWITLASGSDYCCNVPYPPNDYIAEQRSIHGRGVTPSSMKRIARLLGAYGV